MLRFFTLLFLSVVVVVGLAPAQTHAHSGKQSYLYVSVYDDGVEGRVEIPVIDLGPALGIEIPTSTGAARSAIPQLTAPIREYVTDHFALGDESGTWNVQLADEVGVLATENGPYVVIDFMVDEDFDDPPSSFVADFSVIVENDPEKDSLLIIEDDWASATFDNGSEPLLGFSTGQTEQVVDLGGASTVDSMVAVRGIGTDAVRTGIDVMLIVVAVAVPAVMVPSRTRGHVDPAASVARRIGGALLVLIAGHTVTLWLVGLGVVDPSIRVTGILSAAALTAMVVFGLLAWWKPVRWSYSWVVIAAVGLIQGLELGEYFVAQGLDRRRPLTNLLAFNIGVEVGVLIVAALVIVPLALLRRTRIAAIVTLVVGGVLAGYGVAWFLERLFDENWPIEEVANPLRVWPRNLWIALLVVVIAGAVRWLDSRSDALAPIDNTHQDDSRSLRPSEPERVHS